MNKYKKPKIRTKKIKINFFYGNQRFLDSFDFLQNPKVLAMDADPGDCGGCGGCGIGGGSSGCGGSCY